MHCCRQANCTGTWLWGSSKACNKQFDPQADLYGLCFCFADVSISNEPALLVSLLRARQQAAQSVQVAPSQLTIAATSVDAATLTATFPCSLRSCGWWRRAHSSCPPTQPNCWRWQRTGVSCDSSAEWEGQGVTAHLHGVLLERLPVRPSSAPPGVPCREFAVQFMRTMMVECLKVEHNGSRLVRRVQRHTPVCAHLSMAHHQLMFLCVCLCLEGGIG